MTQNGLETTYDLDTFRSMMRSIDAVQDYGITDLEMSGLRLVNKRQLLDYPITGYSLEQRTKDLLDKQSSFSPITILPGVNMIMAPSLSPTIAAIHSQTQLSEAALKYILAYYDAAPDASRLMLTEQDAQPVLDISYKERYEQTVHRRASLQNELETAQGAQKSNIQEQIEQLDLQLADINSQFKISPEALTEYRDIVSRAKLTNYETYSAFYSQNIQSLYKRLREGQIGIEEYIKQANDTLRLMKLEGQ